MRVYILKQNRKDLLLLMRVRCQVRCKQKKYVIKKYVVFKYVDAGKVRCKQAIFVTYFYDKVYHICIYICIYTCTYVYLYKCIFNIYVYIYIYVYICICVYIYI